MFFNGHILIFCSCMIIGLGDQTQDMVVVGALYLVKIPMGFTVLARVWVTVEVCFKYLI